MPRNGSGSYSLPSGNPVTTGTTISSAVQNNTMSDIATALTQSLAKDGQTTPTANLPMGGYKHTGAAAGSARTDYATISNLQDGTGIYVSTVGGTADVITLTPSPAITSYTAGQFFSFLSSGANTTNVTVNVSGLGAKAITKNGSTALVSGDIPSGALISIIYDGTQFQLVALNVNQLASITGLGTGVTTALAVNVGSAGAVVLSNSTDTLSNKTLIAPALGTPASGTLTNCSGYPTVTLGTPTNASSTSVDFTSIPSAAKQIVISFSGLSTNGTSPVIVQIGDSGGLETSSYLGCATALSTVAVTVQYTNGFIIAASVGASSVMHGSLTLTLLNSSSNTWAGFGVEGNSDSQQGCTTAGTKALSSTLDRVRITTVSGTDTFDAGSINIAYY